MSAIKIISASAGTGKTHRLTQELFERITRGDVRPEGILATTFTNKAADELKSRIRLQLLESGRVDAAHRLEAARIGTVNAVCGRLVTEYAFELGLSPDLRILDEAGARIAIRRAMRDAVSEEQSADLTALEMRCLDPEGFSRQTWQMVVDTIVAQARANRIDPAQLSAFAERSVRQFFELLPSPEADGDAPDRDLIAALDAFLKTVSDDGVKLTQGALHQARSMRSPRDATWAEWVQLATGLNPSKKWRDEAEKVMGVARRYEAHPRLHKDCADLIRGVFQAAAATLDAYAKYKAAWGMIDFIDQEVMALELLEQPAVRDQLKVQIDLVLVDEFQDTSPIQLALFLKLSECAEQSLWVGDQKQSIYGFRGTDPVLMDAALNALSGERDVETLPYSWRSRPELVDLTSNLFVTSFEPTGIPEERVRIQAATQRREPGGLGPVIEYWRLNETRNQGGDIKALAGTIRMALEDPDVRVWDPASGEARPVRPGDMAVLCRKNDTCRMLAAALAGQGIPAELSQAGLFATPEGRLCLAGLRLWVDGHDALAMAEIMRLTRYADEDHDHEWLDRIVAHPGRNAFADEPEIQALQPRRKEQPAAGALTALDAVMDALQARTWCRRWGSSRFRLGNLDALRSLAVDHAANCAAEGVACTPAGLVLHFEERTGAGEDYRAATSGTDTVTVSTWHSSKGREWPVVVLFDAVRLPEATPFMVHGVSERDTIDLNDPLADRWIRYWPYPFRKSKAESFSRRAAETEVARRVREEDRRQFLRLLYVVWTRARDRLVLATRNGKLNDNLMGRLCDREGNPLLSEPQGPVVHWGGEDHAITIRDGSPVETQPPAVVADADVLLPDVRSHYPPAFVQPSDEAGTGSVGEPEHIGNGLPLNGRIADASLGNAVHGFLAADRPERTRDERRRMAEELLRRWVVDSVLKPEALLEAADALQVWIKRNWPGATWRREWPLTMRRENGSILRGTADLVLETNGELVLIDHKSFSGSEEQAVAKAATYAGQLQAYAEVLRQATGQPVRQGFIHLPVSGLVVPIAINAREETCP